MKRLRRAPAAALFASAVLLAVPALLRAADAPAPRFAVDPAWPQRPAEAAWGETPGIAIDAAGLVWIYTRARPPVQVYDAQGKYIRGWGADLVKTAHYLRFDRAGNVWIADIGKHVVMQLTPEGKLLKTLGTPGQAGCDATHLNQPTDLVVAPDGGVFVTDGYGNNRVVHFDKDGTFVKAWGKRGRGTGPGEFDLPHSIVMDSKGLLYVADRSNARIQVFDAEGKHLASWENVMVPWQLCMAREGEPSGEPRQEAIWACGSSVMPRPEKGMPFLPPVDQVVVKFDTAGKVLDRFALPKGQDGKEQPGEVNWLHGVAFDAKGDLYTCDIKGKRALKFVRKGE